MTDICYWKINNENGWIRSDPVVVYFATIRLSADFFLRLLPQNSFNDVAEMLQNLSLKYFFWRSIGTLKYCAARAFFKARYIKTWVFHIMRSEVGQTETEKAYQKILKCRYVTPFVISVFKKCSKTQRYSVSETDAVFVKSFKVTNNYFTAILMAR